MNGEKIEVGDTVLFLGHPGKTYSWVPRRAKLRVTAIDLATYSRVVYIARYRGKPLTLLDHEVKKVG